MEKDVVCGMQVDPAHAAGTSTYNGKTFYFCSNKCKSKFDAAPSQYAK
jgi:Cu+-exporting ATPase